VIPKDNDKICLLRQSELVSAIRRVSLFTSPTSPQVRFAIRDSVLVVSAEDAESGNKARELVPCEFEHEPLEIGFNYKYIEESLQHITSEDMSDGKVQLMFSSPTRAVLLKPHSDQDTLLMLVMPMRIS
jgi:DNA polymerase-3 subunit beta